MCDFRILAQNADGYVVHCNNCKTIQIAFGTTLLKVSAEKFAEMKQNVLLECQYRYAAAPAKDIKNIFIPADSDMMFCLTYKELTKLEALFTQASALFETYSILEYI
ncbi:MAG: hypothetical protein EOP51_10420 [Sphingobacteriales bacterium]|nr:MAG: hypothetical protein EOP51_10420 [Sphingobacteriales bacterium]